MQNNYQNMPAQAMPQYFAPQPSPAQIQRRVLRKASNGLGFFVLVYFLLMQNTALVLRWILKLFNVISPENATSVMFMIQIIAGIASSLIAAFFYRIISRRRLSDNFSKSHVKPGKLIPMILIGMGGAMLANQLAAIFDSNISLFHLENTVSQTTSTQSVPEMILYIISTAVMPALAEELAFRGVFMNVMRKYGDAFAIISSSVLFGAMHGNTTQIIFAFSLGLIFAYMDCKANSIVPSVIIHFANNFYAVSTDILATNAGLGENAVLCIRIAVISMFCLLGLLSFIYLAKTDKRFFTLTNDDEKGIAEESFLTMKQKCTACFTSVGIVICLAIFTSEMLLNLIPTDVLTNILR